MESTSENVCNNDNVIVQEANLNGLSESTATHCSSSVCDVDMNITNERLMKTVYTKKSRTLPRQTEASPIDETGTAMTANISQNAVTPVTGCQQVDTGTSSKARRRTFCAQWLRRFKWLRHDKSAGGMFCKLCERYFPQSSSTFVLGNRSFRKLTIQVHEGSKEHQLAVMKSQQDGDMAAVPDNDQDIEESTGKQEAVDDDDEAYWAKARLLSSLYEPRRVRHFCHHWLDRFSWLRYDTSTCLMRCVLCCRHSPDSRGAFVVGNASFRVRSIQGHESTREHRAARVANVSSLNDEVPHCGATVIDDVTQPQTNIAAEQDVAPHNNTRANTAITSEETGCQSKAKSDNYETHRIRKFHRPWLSQFKWLKYDRNANAMFCKICCNYRPQSCSTFVTGNRSFRVTHIRVHAHSREHTKAARHPDSEIWCQPDESSDLECNGDTGAFAEDSRLDMSWLTQFAWLSYDKDQKTLLCDTCSAAGNPVHFDLDTCNWQTLYSHLFSAAHSVDDPSSQTTLRPQPSASERLKHRRKICAQYEKRRVRKFLKHWLTRFPWLKYSRRHDAMFCRLCLRHHGDGDGGTFVRGSRSFRYPAIQAHELCREHRSAAQAEKLAADPHGRLQYILQRHLAFYPWLRCEANTLWCDLCRSRSSLFSVTLQAQAFKAVSQHATSSRHLAAAQAEVDSWSLEYDALIEVSSDLPVDKKPVAETVQQSVKTEPVDDEYDDECSTSSSTTAHSATLPSESELGNNENVLTSTRPCQSELSNNENDCTAQVTPLTMANGSDVNVVPSERVLPVYGRFRREWLAEFQWLSYDSQSDTMQCRLCKMYGKKSSFARGVRIFSRSRLVSHVRQRKHVEAFAQMKQGVLST